MNEDDKDIKYIRALILAYGGSKHVLEADRGVMAILEFLKMKFEKTT